ncbi:indole-3-glycerol-phosphate synthase [Actinomyces sp. 2119]|uniref:indole-3-glycerol-phosphate synthase n=1 Tax=Actinomyces lilanjuaniae TaxID=2321394 RepID=A0ABN5PNG8_9ACTO|nr:MULTISPECIES: indole-3-glycerol phosphate synthase TrpC [Actinomyces]AYD89849.1 indole-3-glycerol-phosphate synthase [Actinomyces lilanjuaniae]RJF44833.1 indole-3-glycerol-phosphate synthase [Actinomyces sp. 2119]
MFGHFEQRAVEARRAVEERERQVPLEAVKELSRTVPGAIDARTAMRVAGRAVTVIAEVRRSTATFADLSGTGDPGVLARFYAAGGAACICVVTGPTASYGSLRDLDDVRAAVDLPVLVNDIIVTPYQVHEARAHGADLVALDARLSPLVLEALVERTHSLGMTAVIKVRTRREALTAMELGSLVVAVDALDLQTLATDRTRFEQVAEVLSPEVIRIACGGVRTPHDVMDCARSGADVVVLGEAVMQATDPQQLVAELVAAGAHPSLLHAVHREAP